MTFAVLSLVLGVVARSPATVNTLRSDSLLLAAGAEPPIARGPLDVIKTTASSFATVGTFGFAITAFQEYSKRAGTAGQARTRMPYFVVQASLAQASRWGRVSAGFSGGRALGQALRGKDDSTCAMLGSIFGGIGAAPNIAGIPSSVATFAAFGYFIEAMSARASSTPSGEQQLERARAQRLKLKSQLEACDREIGRLNKALS
eukprot:CAMPEP_0174731648 /NCGR_PEP_ID=MMETSP1094-20130205/57923_1 /TAXON_ID=156173 /ORGANISM="Chrysochromulina brevifilum, Strain UTEX LB 985" /LENGTH=202 /DNA_ID=CAMNT_0015934059 /DNA_START=89 /DNA_END=697 /DNA_ORIENTATION=+